MHKTYKTIFYKNQCIGFLAMSERNYIQNHSKAYFARPEFYL